MFIPPIARSVLLVLTAVLFSNVLPAQQAKEYSFTHYTTSSGLLSNQVNTIIQDEQGFMWIGGTDGIQRFDGIRYLSFRHRANDSLSLSSNPVMQLILDKQKRMWVLLADGDVGIFNTRTFTFQKKTVHTKNTTAHFSTIKRLVMDYDGNVFYLFGGVEVVTWNDKKNEFSPAYNFFKILPGWAVADFAYEPGTQKYWISIQGGGLAIYNKATGQLSYKGNNVEHEPAIDAIKEGIQPNKVLFDQQGRVWFFHWPSVYPTIYCFDVKTNKIEEFQLLTMVQAYHEVHSFYQQKDGTIWVSGVKVFAKFLEKEKKFQMVYNGYTNERSIAYEVVTDLCEDREGNVWAGTDNSGLYRFNPATEHFTNITHRNRLTGNPGNGTPMSLIETRQGTYFVGVWEDGLYHYDSNFNVQPAHIKGLDDKGGPFVWCMEASADSNIIWMGSQPGIYAVDQAKRSAAFYNPEVLQSRTVRQLAEDKKRNLWIGMMHSGVYKWKAVNGKVDFKVQPEKISAVPSTGINRIIVDREGLVWIGTDIAGLFVIDPETGKLLMHFDSHSNGNRRLPEQGVSSMLDYNDSLMVISTGTRVLLYNRISKLVSLVGPPDVMSGYITAIERDKNGFVWITSSSGLYRVSLRRGVFVRFNKDDGIHNDNFVLSSSRHLKDGRLFFGSSNQFILFDPLGIINKKADLQVNITGFEVMNKSLSVDSLLGLKQVTLGYDENSLAIYFSLLQYNYPGLIQYKLEGLDKEWQFADKDNKAIYSYLPAGNYTLRFKIIDEDGNVNDSTLTIQIKVNPPFWKSWWFFSMGILVIGCSFFFLDKARTKRKEAVEKMRSNIADNLHQEVNTALNNINILSEMAKLKAGDEPEKSKEFIEQIHNKSHNMIIAMDDMLWSISPENDSMEKSVERMQEYIDALSNRHQVIIEMLVDEKVRSLKLDMQLRHEAFLLFKESIKGLLTAGANNCKIHVALEKSGLLYSIQFNNAHCDTQQLNNLLQRQDITKRLAGINAVMSVAAHQHISIFELKVPVV